MKYVTDKLDGHNHKLRVQFSLGELSPSLILTTELRTFKTKYEFFPFVFQTSLYQIQSEQEEVLPVTWWQEADLSFPRRAFSLWR